MLAHLIHSEGVAAGMARSLGGFLVLILLVSICDAASVFQPISDSHRSAALELFSPVDGSFGRFNIVPQLIFFFVLFFLPGYECLSLFSNLKAEKICRI